MADGHSSGATIGNGLYINWRDALRRVRKEGRMPEGITQ